MKLNPKAFAISALIDSVIHNTKIYFQDHWNTLLGERSSGSQFGFNMSEKIMRSIPWTLTLDGTQSEDFRLAKYSPDCIYLTCSEKDMPLVNIKGIGKAKAKMTNNIKLLPEIARSSAREHWHDDKLIPNFYPYEGEHGWELRSAEVRNETPADSISMVIGWQEDRLIIFTIHPDPVAEQLPNWFTESGDIDRLMNEMQAGIDANSNYHFSYTLPQYAIKSAVSVDKHPRDPLTGAQLRDVYPEDYTDEFGTPNAFGDNNDE